MGKLSIFKKVAAVLAIPVVIVGILLIHHYKMKRADNYYSSEYLLIEKKEFIDDKVSSIFLPKGFKDNPYALYVVMEKTGKRTLIADMDYKQRTINDVIKVGTIITKQKDNDTVVLKSITSRDTAVYYFKILNRDFK